MIIRETEKSFADRNNENSEAYWGAWTAYSKTIAEAGIMRGGTGLQMPETATTVIFHGDKKTVHDGPYLDSKEQLGGFFIIEVADLDEALLWAKRLPVGEGGKVELRPVLPRPSEK